LLIAIVTGALLGIIGSRYLFVGSGLSLIPWGIIGLAIGYWSQKREWLINGGVYGFALAFVFMIAGYTGSESLISRLPFFAIIGVVGGVCGIVLGALGFVIKSRMRRSSKNHPSSG
jgi:hypothetical protein